MLNYTDYHKIADSVFESLNIPEDIYTTFTTSSANDFYNQYIRNDDYIEALVDIELQKYDTYDNVPDDLEDIRQNAIDEVNDRLSAIIDNYYHMQTKLLEDTYAQIVQNLMHTNFDNITDVDIEFEPADPEVGIFNEERRIVFTLSNGATITFNVEFEGD